MSYTYYCILLYSHLSVSGQLRYGTLHLQNLWQWDVPMSLLRTLLKCSHCLDPLDQLLKFKQMLKVKVELGLEDTINLEHVAIVKIEAIFEEVICLSNSKETCCIHASPTYFLAP